MAWSRKLLAGLIVLNMLCLVGAAYAFPSGETLPPTFTHKNGEWYDSWGYTRTYYGGTNGYLPNVAYETLGANQDKAYSIGQWFAAHYTDKVQRAEAIMNFIQTWTRYGYDKDNVVMGGEAQEEWAWNADEMAYMFNQTTGAKAIGDCEDMAFLGTTIYTAAGFDVTMVSPPGHVAFMIWLPEYDNANCFWDLSDGRGSGWIWVELTGKDNPLGWTPPDFNDGNFDVYPISSSSMISGVSFTPQDPLAEDDVTVTVSLAPGSGSISQILLYYSVGGGAYNTVLMTIEGSSCQGTIPKQEDGTDVSFHVTVEDTQGNVSESSEYSYTVGGAGLQIPGFPLESILVGLALGLVALYFVARKRSAPSKSYLLRG
jgi:hypothetical protein